ncbi:MAG: glycosyltransferase family 4 protein [Planctomycetota bacterium]
MNILLVTDSYPPEIRSASNLMYELAECLKVYGHNICALTSNPRYNLSSPEENDLPEYKIENGIKVLRAKTLPHHKINFVIRGIAQLTMPKIFLACLAKYVKEKIDVVIVYSPPLPLARVGESIKTKHNAKFILNVQDVFPQNAIDLGVLANPMLIRFFEHIEKKAYRAADKIIVHSKGNKLFLTSQKNIDDDKVDIIHNWVDVSGYNGKARSGRFRKKYCLNDKFIFLFAGVIGPSQGLDLVIEAASRVRDFPDMCFLLVGDGTDKPRLQQMAWERKLENVLFHPFVSAQEYPELVKDADVGLVCLSSRNKTPVVPGKIMGYMAAGIPVLAFLQEQSDGHELIRDAQCGYSATSDNLQKAVEMILEIYKNRHRLSELGNRGAAYAKKYLTIEKAIEKLQKLF